MTARTFIERARRSLRRRTIAALRIGAPQQVIELPANNSVARRKVLLVGPALMPIPPTGWGAVETVIWEQAQALRDQGVDVTIVNSPRWTDWIRARPWLHGNIVVHYEPWLRRAFLLRRLWGLRVVAYSHYGLLEFPEQWDRGYARLLRRVLNADVAVALNPRIAELMQAALGRRAEVALIPNGSDFQPAFRSFRPRNVLVLGKVEPRKRQYELFRELRSSGIDIAFVGPIVDDRVRQLLKDDPSLVNVFLGAWDREVLRQQMSDFKLLLLDSKGEADALVLYEAQLAGLSVLVSPQGLGAQDPGLPWIHLLEQERDVAEAITCTEKEEHSAARIAEYAALHYRWNRRILPLVNALAG